MTIYDKGGYCLHIYGKNDWGYLLADALQPLLDYALGVLKRIDDEIAEYKGETEVIGLGKNEFRAVDILHRLRGFGDPIKIYKGIPVVQLQTSDKIELYGQQKTMNYHLSRRSEWK